MKKIVLFLTAVMCASFLFAQEDEYNPQSTKRIRKTDQMYKKRLIRALDLREPQNKTLFARNHEITRFLLEAVKAGKLQAYTNDSLNTVMTLEEVAAKLIIPGSDDSIDYGGLCCEGFEPEVKSGPEEYFYNQLYQMEVTEDLIFDKQRSGMYRDIIAITIFIPADVPENIRGLQEPIATFSYKDCKALFESSPDAIAFNPKNDREHFNLADAFELWMFSSYIIKVSNPDDSYIVDEYETQKQGIIVAKQKEFELMEFEHNMWEN